jgi:hypothetical protein
VELVVVQVEQVEVVEEMKDLVGEYEVEVVLVAEVVALL